MTHNNLMKQLKILNLCIEKTTSAKKATKLRLKEKEIKTYWQEAVDQIFYRKPYHHQHRFQEKIETKGALCNESTSSLV